MAVVDPKYLKEYRCRHCHKLLCRGFLNDQHSTLEIKCRGCGNLCLFNGQDPEIASHRAILISQGLVPGAHKEKQE